MNHTEHAYHDAVTRLKSMLADTYNAVKHNSRGVIYDSDDTDNISVIIVILLLILFVFHLYQLINEDFVN